MKIQSRISRTTMTQQTLRDEMIKWIEANYLDGDKVQEGQMLSSMSVVEIVMHFEKERLARFKEFAEEMIGDNEEVKRSEHIEIGMHKTTRNALRNEQREILAAKFK